MHKHVKETRLAQRWTTAMDEYRAAQIRMSRDHLLRPDGVPARETVVQARAALAEVRRVRSELRYARLRPGDDGSEWTALPPRRA